MRDSLLDQLEELLHPETTKRVRYTLFTEVVKRPITAESLLVVTKFLQERMILLPIRGEAIDNCGTGGTDKNHYRHAHNIHISTLAAFVVAGTGVRVVKQCGNGASHPQGSADFLTQAGIRLDIEVGRATEIYRQTQLLLLPARRYPPHLARIASLRRLHEKPTIFNLAAPLCNPAGIRRRVIGVNTWANALLMAEVVMELGLSPVAIIHAPCGSGGLDEISVTGNTDALLIEGADCREDIIHPRQMGISETSFPTKKKNTIKGTKTGLSESLRILENEPSFDRLIVLANAAFVVHWATGLSLSESYSRVHDTLKSGRARALFESYRTLSVAA